MRNRGKYAFESQYLIFCELEFKSRANTFKYKTLYLLHLYSCQPLFILIFFIFASVFDSIFRAYMNRFSTQLLRQRARKTKRFATCLFFGMTTSPPHG